MQTFFELEHRGERPITRRLFVRRLVRHGGFASMIVGVSIVIGTIGYRWLGDMPWIDSFLNACMILGGMGQVGDVKANSGKVFAALFALYAGMIFLIVSAVVLTPIFHRVLHRFHWEADHSSQ